MTQKTIDLVKKLREKTGAGIMDCKKALVDGSNDLKKAEALLKEKGLAKAKEKADRETKQGYVATYTHSNGKTGSMVELLSETDFVARNQEFRRLAQELCLQVAAMDPKNVKELLNQDYIREPEKKIKDLIEEIVIKFGENIKIGRFQRFEI